MQTVRTVTLVHIVALLSVHMSVHPYVLSVHTKNGFHSIFFFEKISLLDSYLYTGVYFYTGIYS